MVARYTLLFLIMLWGCKTGPPTGPSYNLHEKMTMNAVLYPGMDSIVVWLSEWYECSASEDCEKDPWLISVVDAQVSIQNTSGTWAAQENSLEGTSYYYNGYRSNYVLKPLPFPVESGQEWFIAVDHPEYNFISARTIIPESVIFLKPESTTLANTQKSVSFKWKPSTGAEGYQPELKCVGIHNSGETIEIDIPRSFQYSDEGFRSNEYSTSRDTLATYDIEVIVNKVNFYFNEGYGMTLSIDQFTHFYLVLYVNALNEGLFYANTYQELQPDEGDGFNVPVQAYSNVSGGGGLLAAYNRTHSYEIVIPVELLKEWIR